MGSNPIIGFDKVLLYQAVTGNEEAKNIYRQFSPDFFDLIKLSRIISDYLKSSDRFAKTIIFCETTDHAERMRVALVNENADLVEI